jgi:hypothetical protein
VVGTIDAVALACANSTVVNGGEIKWTNREAVEGRGSMGGRVVESDRRNGRSDGDGI